MHLHIGGRNASEAWGIDRREQCVHRGRAAGGYRERGGGGRGRGGVRGARGGGRRPPPPLRHAARRRRRLASRVLLLRSHRRRLGRALALAPQEQQRYYIDGDTTNSLRS